MKRKATIKAPSAVALTSDLWSVWRSSAVAAGIELDLFTPISQGKTTAQEVATAAGTHEGATRRLLDALVALGYLRRKGERYSLQPLARTYLVRGGELYVEHAAEVARMITMLWGNLAQAVRSGRPVLPTGPPQDADPFMPALVKSIFPLNFPAAKAALAALGGPARKRIKSILDVAAGSGAWSLPFALGIPQARVTVADYPAVTKITREFAGRYGVGDRYDYIEGSIRETDFGRDRYDLVILGHIIHSEGAEWGRRLIQKSADALHDKGMILIGEFIPNDERTGPVMAMLFGLNMMLATEQGDVYTMKEYREWLKAAGFKTIKTIRAPAPSPLILASK
jgi:2-polyprenyl-3-methyl-5-hydroxy-6-metoxy-1,4-benzoquinol methylase